MFAICLPTPFSGDPFTSILLGGDLSLESQELRANVRGALVGPGQVHILEIGENVSDIVGVAIWYPPGARAFARCVFYLHMMTFRVQP